MIALMLALILGSTADFCSGYRQGFTAAYCQGHQFCVAAPVPACPAREGSWQEGYDEGYSAGERMHPHHSSSAE